VDKKTPTGGGSERAEPSAADIRAREQAAYRHLLNQKCAPYLSELTLGLLHRFNNVFTGVLFLTDDCLARAAGDEPMQERLREIANVLRISHSFVDRVVHLHIAEEEDDTSYYDVNAVVANELETLALLLPKGAVIDHSPTPEPACFYGSKQAVCEILLHLIDNAGAAVRTEGGGVWISSRTVEGDGLLARTEVVTRDNGPGFEEKVLPYIFDPLFTTKDRGHAGLGLFRARQLARANKGDLLARNHPGGGAEFILTLAQTNPDSGS
jgi:signal transduction histidine kinase